MLVKSGTTTDAYATTKLFPEGKSVNMVVSNKHASRVATLKVWGYVTKGDTDSGVEIRAEADLAGDTDEEVSVTKLYEEIIISIKTKTTPNHLDYEIHAIISKVGV